MATIVVADSSTPPEFEAVTLSLTREEARQVRAALWASPLTDAGSRVFVVLRDADI